MAEKGKYVPPRGVAGAKKQGGWDWEESWFNPNRSEYIKNKKIKQDAEARAKVLAAPPVQGTSQYVLMNAGQKANVAAGRQPNDYGSPPKEMSFDDFLAQMGGSSTTGGGSGFDTAAYVANLVNQINEGYDRRIGVLGQNRASSLQQINTLADQYKQNVGNINQSYLQGVAAQNQEIARRAAEQQAMAQRVAQQLSTSLAGEGISAQPIQGQAQTIQGTLAATNQFQRDLQDRMAQLAASANAGALSGGELVRQGAAGTLENNYNSLLNALQSAREQEIMQAQTSASRGGGGGGGGGGSSSDPIDQLTKYLKGRQLWDEVMGGGGIDIQSLMLNAAKKQPYDFLAGLSSNPELAKLIK